MPHLLRAGRNAAQLPLFLEHDLIAVGWDALGDSAGLIETTELKARMREVYPDMRPGQIAQAAGQVSRFIDLDIGETVCVYDPETRRYHVSRVRSPYRYDATAKEYRHRHDVEWVTTLARDALSKRTRSALGSIATLSSINEEAWAEMSTLIAGESSGTGSTEPEKSSAEEDDEVLDDSREEIINRATEFIKDRIAELDWRELEDLCAGVLRGMGYKTLMTDTGSDGGRDVMASPDGLGLESPRIIVEVKHRKGSMGAPDIRNLLGGLRQGDKGLYISTGGFTREARYEADRANTPITLIDLDRLVSLITQYYDAFDSDTRALLPLRKIYWPV